MPLRWVESLSASERALGKPDLDYKLISLVNVVCSYTCDLVQNAVVGQRIPVLVHASAEGSTSPT